MKLVKESLHEYYSDAENDKANAEIDAWKLKKQVSKLRRLNRDELVEMLYDKLHYYQDFYSEWPDYKELNVTLSDDSELHRPEYDLKMKGHIDQSKLYEVITEIEGIVGTNLDWVDLDFSDINKEELVEMIIELDKLPDFDEFIPVLYPEQKEFLEI